MGQLAVVDTNVVIIHRDTNAAPSGSVSLVGTPVQGNLLIADTSTLADADGLGAFSYAWYASGNLIAGASTSAFEVTALEIGKVISATVSYTDGKALVEHVSSLATAEVSAPSSRHLVDSTVSFWNGHAPMTGVTASLDGTVDSGATGSQLIGLRNIVLHDDGSRTVEIWVNATEAVDLVQLFFSHPDSSSASWQSGDALPAGWTIAPDTGKQGVIGLSTSGSGTMSAGEFMLGRLSLSAPAAPEDFFLGLDRGSVNTTSVASRALWKVQTTSGSSGADGKVSIELLHETGYAMTTSKAVDDSVVQAVKSADALAALKLAVGLNPNSGGAEVSSYQYLAADVDANGKVTASDALAILKMAVHMSSAPAAGWVFVPASVGSVTMGRTSVDWSAAATQMTVNGDMTVDLVGIVKGDVNGSWTPPAG